MIFRKRKSINPFKIYLDDIEISESDMFNFLGFHFNNTLTWKNDISVKYQNYLYYQKLTIYLSCPYHKTDL